MTEEQATYGNNPVRNIEDVEILRCPYCDKSLIEYTGVILGFRIMCPGCEKVIVAWKGEWPVG